MGIAYFFLFIAISQRPIVIKACLINSSLIEASRYDLHTKILRLTTHMFRTVLFFITSACILAVDFPYFSMKKAKTSEFGISLMDIGVGYFILSHSMRLIRNMNIETELVKV